jgi:MerR-like DNA binding protein
LTLTQGEGGILGVMFSIGEFARLGGVSVRTLRHYDEIGLLQPATVDPDTGYRGYSADQLGPLRGGYHAIAGPGREVWVNEIEAWRHAAELRARAGCPSG